MSEINQPVLFSQFTLEQLTTVIRDIIRTELLTQNKKEIKDSLEEKLLSPKEVCEIFKPRLSKSSLFRWVKAGKIIQHRLGSRPVYRYSEIIEAAKILKRYK